MTITDITPEAYLCGLSGACPAVYATDRGTLIVIGKVVPAGELRSSLKMAHDETVIEIPRGLVAGIGGEGEV